MTFSMCSVLYLMHLGFREDIIGLPNTIINLKDVVFCSNNKFVSNTFWFHYPLSSFVLVHLYNCSITFLHLSLSLFPFRIIWSPTNRHCRHIFGLHLRVNYFHCIAFMFSFFLLLRIKHILECISIFFSCILFPCSRTHTHTHTAHQGLNWFDEAAKTNLPTTLTSHHRHRRR